MAAQRLRSIDCLRGVAALAVAFGHALLAAPYTDFAGTWFEQFCIVVRWLSATGVPLFFVISGFCIHLAQAKHVGFSRFHFMAFWRRRMWRLYPTYFVALVGSIGLLLLMLATGRGEEPLAYYPDPKAQSILVDGAVHALMLHGLHPFYDHGAGNISLWTLAREEYLYLMYPLLLVLRRRWQWYTTAIAMAAMTITIEALTPYVAPTPEWAGLLVSSAPALWLQWQLGAVAADAYLGLIRLPPFFMQARWVPVWIVLGYVAPLKTIWLGLAYFTLVNACVKREAEGRWFTTWPFTSLTRSGLWSYSLYLVHHPVQTAALALLIQVMPGTGVVLFVLRAIVLTAIGCAAGWLLFVLVERHFLISPARPGAADTLYGGGHLPAPAVEPTTSAR